MKSKDDAARAVLRLLLDMKWPDKFQGEECIHGGLRIEDGVDRLGNRCVQIPRATEMYVGAYSPLADAIRDWQAAEEPGLDPDWSIDKETPDPTDLQ